jgi:hypothetical protein
MKKKGRCGATALTVIALCPKRILVTNRVEERRNGIYVRWQAKSKGIRWMTPRPAPPPLYGETFVHREDTCCGVRMQAKAGKKGGGPCGGRNKENQDFTVFVVVLEENKSSRSADGMERRLLLSSLNP